MSFSDRLRTAWDCSECRFFRRAAVVFVVLAASALVLL